MAMPFPGMDPYLEHPALWTGVHSGMINAIRGQIAPALRPRYVVSIEERVVIDLPQHQRVPDLWIQKPSKSVPASGSSSGVVLESPVVMEFSNETIREPYIEILDRYQALQVVTVLELLSPINKAPGPGCDQYLKKRNATLNSSTHLVEIDLLRFGQRACSLTEAQLSTLGAFDYLIAINRSLGHHQETSRTRFEFIPRRLRQRLPTFGLPLVSPDPDVPLDLQAALERVYDEGSYMLRIQYEKPCIPELPSDDQQWAKDCWNAYLAAHAELFH